MNLPTGISVTDAKALIVNAEQNIFDGRAVTNRKVTWKQCRTCYVKYSPNQPECPKCAISKQPNISRQWRWERNKEALYVLACCMAGMAIIAMCAYSIAKFLYWLF
jgi:hypothetical protein